MTTVQEIHNEFYSAEERLLNEAIYIIENPRVDRAKNAARYVSLGFGSCKPVKDSQNMAKKEAEAKGLKETIQHFQTYYPNNKFITEEEVKRICEKYGLLLGDATNYIGDIPEKNLAEIEAFKLRKEDWTDKKGPFFSIWDIGETQGLLGMLSSRTRAWNPEPDQMDYFRSKYQVGFDPFQKNEKKPEKEKAAFKICAPQTDFNTAGYVVKDGFKLVYDPVVLQPVKGGFLIVSAWGEEASDELVVNQKMN